MRPEQAGAALALGLLATGCTTVSSVADEDRVVPFQCQDVVLVGRLKNGDFEHLDMDGDILGHGWINAQLRVRRCLTGPPVPPVVPVRYFAHTYLRERREFMFVVQSADEGHYIIKTARLMADHPRLASHCN